LLQIKFIKKSKNMIFNILKSTYRFFSNKYQTLHLEYKVSLKPRYGHGKPEHTRLNDIISQNDALYASYLTSFLNYKTQIQAIQKCDANKDENLPCWNNDYLPGLDIISLYGMLCLHRPAQYIEVGSGNSTKVARKAIREQQLATKITSIDPYPRAQIDQLADKIIRMPFENMDDPQSIIATLNENDILFIDNSHRVFPNSDATVFFLEILPYLKKGVIVHIHDIYLPYDYPQFMCDRFYNEQYTLAAFILANPKKYVPLLPNYYISEKASLAANIASIWQHPNLEGVERHGGSFWLKIGE
jgi:hypothetical protein